MFTAVDRSVEVTMWMPFGLGHTVSKAGWTNYRLAVPGAGRRPRRFRTYHCAEWTRQTRTVVS
jgi:hypothetical protein